MYILIEGNVYTEYQTYLKNKTNGQIQYAHVDSVNIFKLIEEILSKPRNNPIHTFERFSEIESWLREQWAGLFEKLVQGMTSQQQISTLTSQVNALTSQVNALSGINTTLQRYLEALVTKASPDDAPELIEYENKRLNELEALRQNQLGKILADRNIDVNQYRDALLTTETFQEFKEKLNELAGEDEFLQNFSSRYINNEGTKKSLNEALIIVGKKSFPP